VPVALTVVNAGRAAVTVEGFHVTLPSGRRALAEVERVKGPALPHRLEAHASETWVADALPAAQAVDREGGQRDDPFTGPAQFRFAASAGHGKTARDRLTFVALRIITEARDA
jgi:hypothetical protein